MLFTLYAALTRQQRFDLLSALVGHVVADDGSLDELALFDEISAVLRDALEAPAGHLTETLRRRMVEIGEALDLVQYPGFEPEDARSWDQVDDQQLLWAIGERLTNEVEAINQVGNDALAIVLGRRLLAFPGAARRGLLLRIAAIPGLTAVRRPSHAELRDTLNAVLAGDASVVQFDDRNEPPSRALLTGTWVCECLADVTGTVFAHKPGTSTPADAVYVAAPAAGELLAAWLLDEDARTGSPASGFADTSSRTRARRARTARVAATLALAGRAYTRRPEPLIFDGP